MPRGRSLRALRKRRGWSSRVCATVVRYWSWSVRNGVLWVASVGKISMRACVVPRAASGKSESRKREMVARDICSQLRRIVMA